MGDDIPVAYWQPDPNKGESELTGPLSQAIDPAIQQAQQLADAKALFAKQATDNAFNYTPEQLGWSPEEAARFISAGYTQLPGMMNKASIYGPGVSLGNDDPIQSFIDFGNKPTYFDGKSGKVLSNMSTAGMGDINNWTPDDQKAYQLSMLQRKWEPNEGWYAANKGLVNSLGIFGTALASMAGAAALGPALGAVGTGVEVGTGAGAGAGLSGLELGADLGYSAAQLAPGGLGGTGALAAGAGAAELGTPGGLGAGAGYMSPDLIGEAIAGGQAAGADVGMGAGTSWLTDLGLPASYGNDLGALLSYGGDKLINLDWGALASNPNLISSLLGGGVGALTGGTAAGTTPTSVYGGSTSAPQTSQIAPTPPMGQGVPMAPPTMPTGSIMGAFGNKGSNDDYKKYFSTIF
jgi:hypothetical protein